MTNTVRLIQCSTYCTGCPDDGETAYRPRPRPRGGGRPPERGARRRRDSDQPRRDRRRRDSALLDREGLDALSMRRLGDELGAGAASLYWHVGSKDGLLDLVLDEIIGEQQVPDPDPPRWPSS